MRSAKIISAIKDCTLRVFSALISNERNYHKFKYSTSVQITSDVSNVLGGIKRNSRGFLGAKKAKRVISDIQQQRTLR